MPGLGDAPPTPRPWPDPGVCHSRALPAAADDAPRAALPPPAPPLTMLPPPPPAAAPPARRGVRSALLMPLPRLTAPAASSAGVASSTSPYSSNALQRSSVRCPSASALLRITPSASSCATSPSTRLARLTAVSCCAPMVSSTRRDASGVVLRAGAGEGVSAPAPSRPVGALIGVAQRLACSVWGAGASEKGGWGE